MPQIICAWCLYIGMGKTPKEQWNDVSKHEKDCVYFLNGVTKDE